MCQQVQCFAAKLGQACCAVLHLQAAISSKVIDTLDLQTRIETAWHKGKKKLRLEFIHAHDCQQKGMVEMGLEPMTFRLLDECSNQLSYTTDTTAVQNMSINTMFYTLRRCDRFKSPPPSPNECHFHGVTRAPCLNARDLSAD